MWPLLIFLVINFAFANGAYCTLGPDGTCTFYGVYVTDGSFEPTTDDPDAVINIKFENSRLTVLSSEICERFKNLKRLELKSLFIERIEKGALDSCLELHTIGLWNNNLKEIDEDSFLFNTRLEAIHLQNNQIKEIKPKTFAHLKKLMILDFSENYLTGFPVFKMDPLPSLKKLFIDTNEITDIDEQEMTLKFPNLEDTYLNDNPFDCTRLQTILQHFKQKQIKVTRWDSRNRHYGLLNQGEAECSETIKIAAIKDETMWIRGQTKQINSTLVNDVQDLRLKTKQNRENLGALDKNFNETAKDLSKGINHTQESLAATNRQVASGKRDFLKFKRDETERDNKIMKNVSTIETKVRNLQGQVDKNQAALSETMEAIQNVMKELTEKLEKIKTKVNANTTAQ